MGNITNQIDLPKELVTDMFSKVKGHSSLAALCGTDPIPFSGTEVMTFSLDAEAELVGEGGEKSPGPATFEPVDIKPFKVIYQHRLTDEFIKSSEEKRLPYLKAFGEGFSRKIARAVDITAFHGINPRTGLIAAGIRPKCFDQLITNVVTYNSAKADENIEDAVALIQANERDITGIAMAPAFGAAMAKIKVNGVIQYPEFRFGGKPSNFAGYGCDINTTVKYGINTKDVVIIGDFANAFKWGYAENMPLEVIQYGDPDGQGDLKRKNQIVLRAEAYIGFGILDKDSFALIKTAGAQGATGATGA